LSLVVSTFIVAWHQDAIAQGTLVEKNTKALKSYLQPYALTRLEWELLQFNLLWSGAYTPPSSYLTSFPVMFDYKSARFRASFGLAETREYQDTEPWSRLSRVKRESILQGAVDQLSSLLGQSFPEIKSRPELIFVEFKFRQPGGGFVNAAKFENGALILSD